MSKTAATLEPVSDAARTKRTRKPRVSHVDPNGPQLAVVNAEASRFPTKPLLLGVGIGAALALTAVAFGSRPARRSYLGGTPPTVAGAFTKTAMVLLARVVARKALAAAANQGVRKLASAWPL